MNIGIDIDEVLTLTNNYFLEELNKKFNKNISKEQIKDYYFKSLKETFGEFNYELKLTEFLNKNLIYFEIDPFTKIILEKLKKEEHNLFILSARGVELQKKTISWIENHFGKEYFDKILFNKQNNRKFSKAEICKMYDIDLLIEDAPHHAFETSLEKIPVLLVDRPWNYNLEENDFLIRVYNWEDIYEKIKFIEEENRKIYKYNSININ